MVQNTNARGCLTCTVTTKLWNVYHKKEHVREAFNKQLKDLNLSYVDLYLIHCK